MIRIYTLASSEFPQEIRYVGITTKELNVRLVGHLNQCKKKRSIRDKWEWSVINNGHKLLIELVDIADENNWQDLERYWIFQFRAWGFRLVNGTEGGDGTIGFAHSDHSRKLISENNVGMRGKTHSVETKMKISTAKMGNNCASGKRSLQSIQNISNGKKGKTIAKRKNLSMNPSAIKLREYRASLKLQSI